jgi:hypothetical protein
MRRLITAIVTTFVLQAGLWTGTAVAAQSDLLFGEHHSYSVTMRGNGEAVVTARIVLTNTSDQPMTKFSFEIPKLQVTELTGYQQHIPNVCQSGGPLPLTPSNGPAKDTSSNSTGTAVIAPPVRCLTNTQQYYLQDQYGSSGSTYTRLQFDNLGGTKYSVTLPTAVGPQDSTGLLLGYAGRGYAQGRFGAYSFDFQTLRVGERVKDATVAVDVDGDQYLLDGQTKVSYGAARGSKAAASLPNSAATSNSSLDTIAYGLGQGGEINKEAKDLAAGDTFSVKGTYADASWKLHPGTLTSLGLVGLAVLGVVIWAVRRMRKARPVKVEAKSDAPSKPEVKPADEKVLLARLPTRFADPLIILVALGSVIAVGLITWALLYFTNQQNYSSDTFTEVITFIAAILAYVLVVLGPVVWLAAQRKDWKVAVYMVVWQVMWLVVLIVVYVFGISRLIDMQSNNPGIIQTGGAIQPD